MRCSLYLRKGILYVPTKGQMERGFYRGVEPVAVAPLSNTGAIREALLARFARGNPIVPMLLRRDWPPPVVLKHAGVKTWSAFERGMLFWEITDEDGAFRIAEQRKQSNGMWNDDPEKTITFPPGSTTDQVIERMVSILQEAAKK